MEQVLTHILIAKGQICYKSKVSLFGMYLLKRVLNHINTHDVNIHCNVALLYFVQQYDKSRTLLLAADGVIHPISYPISRMIRGEVLYVDLLQYYNTTGSVAQDLGKRVKTCVNSLHVDKGQQKYFCYMKCTCIISRNKIFFQTGLSQ